MEDVNPGEVYRLDHDTGRAEDPAYSHPHVVMHVERASGGHVLAVDLCAISTHPARRKEPGNVVLEEGEAGLVRGSTVVVSRALRVPPSRLRERVGALPASRLVEIHAGRALVQGTLERHAARR